MVGAFLRGNQTTLVLANHFQVGLLGLSHDLLLFRRNGGIDNGNGDAAAGGVFVALRLDPVQNLGGLGGAVNLDAALDNLA